MKHTLKPIRSLAATYNSGNLSPNMNTWSRPNGMSTQLNWYAANAGANALSLKGIHHSQGGNTVSKFGYSY